MLKHRSFAALGTAALLGSLLVASPVLANEPLDDGAVPRQQHGSDEGHLLGSGAWGKIQLVSQLTLSDDQPELIADVGIDPDGDYAYLANWGFPDCAGPEAGGMKSPDAGIYVVDISDLENPVEVGFIPTHQDTRPGEGVQVESITTKFFSGDMLAFNHEACGKNYKGGFALWDVTDPLKPKRLSVGFGDRTVEGSRRMISDANESHSVFIWDAGDRAYLVAQDEWESADVDIFDITNPRRPVLVSEVDLNEFGVGQPDLVLTNSFLHDMLVKQMPDGRFIMLASYWDGGYALLDVTDPASPQFIGDTEYEAIDPLLLEMAGGTVTPEGNAHQAEFTIDNRFIIGTDEDFAPFRIELSYGGEVYQATQALFGPSLSEVPVSGQVVWVGGTGCTAAEIPEAPTDDSVALIQRGACFFQNKAEAAFAQGYVGYIVANTAAAGDALINMAPRDEGPYPPIPGVFVRYSTGEALKGAVGEPNGAVNASLIFDGWGYVHLFDAQRLLAGERVTSIDQYAIPEAMNPAFATGFGDLSVHEVAVDPIDASLAYLAYYSGGLRAIQIQCADPTDTSTCELVEVGGYLDAAGNNFWGVETFVVGGETYILASDRDSGLWIFKDP